ncbi:MAG TPA: hypothetical protein VLA37_12380 [Sphingomonadaceae bacterium]|nr:hypothetical protein [Sphingomonadaceae bacterium]
MALNFSRLGSGLVGNLSAQGTATIAYVLVQLVSVPILAQSWGLEKYGIWLILFTLPGYIIASPAGLVGAAANEATTAFNQGREEDARLAFQTMTLALGAICLVALVPGWLVTFGSSGEWLEFATQQVGYEAIPATFLLVAYGCLVLFGAGFETPFRAVGAYAKAAYLQAFIVLFEAGIALGLVLAGGGLGDAAAGFLVGRAIGTGTTVALASSVAPQFMAGAWRFSMSELRRLAGPSIALAMVPIGFALSLQATVAVLAAAAGPAAVPAFTAVRTLARAAIQVTSVVSRATIPEYTIADARGDRARKLDLLSINIAAALAILLPGLLAMLLLGPWFVNAWTGGEITASLALVAALGASAVLGGLWLVVSNLILATNQQSAYGYAFAIMSALALVPAYLLSQSLGASGAAAAMLLLDAAMFVWVLLQARRLGHARPGDLLAAPRRALALVRSRWPSLFIGSNRD